MTDFKELFNRAHYGSYGDSYQKQIRIHITDPETIFEAKYIKLHDDWAADNIKEMETAIAMLKEYRHILAGRYADLETCAAVPVIKLRRHKEYWKDNKVFYYLEEITRYLDKPDAKAKTSYTDVVKNITTFPGSERRDALKAFEAYKKAHPGIIAIKDIEKSKWER